MVLIISGMLLFKINFGLTVGTMVWMYIPEITQPHIVTLSTTIIWTVGAIISTMFPIVVSALPHQNPSPIYFFFGAYSFVELFINHRFIVETKGKTEDEIIKAYQHL